MYLVFEVSYDLLVLLQIAQLGIDVVLLTAQVGQTAQRRRNHHLRHMHMYIIITLYIGTIVEHANEHA